MDLVEFLRARLDEDEAVARLIGGDRRWYADESQARVLEAVDEWADGDDRLPNYHTNWHLVLDSDRLFREIEASRRLVHEHDPIRTDFLGVPKSHLYCPICGAAEEYVGHDYPCLTLRLLALPYSGHPDYDPTWAS